MSPLTEAAPPSQAHSGTSQAAAESMRENAGTLRARVLTALREAGPDGLTDEQMQTRLGMNPSTQRPRRIELVKAGRVVATPGTRPTASGRSATVWVATTEPQE